MVDKERARARAEECRRIAQHLASTPIAKENWERLAEQWEAELDNHDEQSQGQYAVGEIGSAAQQQREF